MNQKNKIGAAMFRRYAEFIVSHRKLVIAAIVLATVLLMSRLMNLQVDMDQDTWVPQSHSYVQTTKILEETFGGRNVTLIGILPKQGDIYQPAILAKVDRIQRAIEELPEAIRHNVMSLSARKVKDIKGDEEGLQVTRIMERVPETPEEIEKLKNRVESNPVYIDSLVSKDGKAIAVIADFKIDTSKPSYADLYKKIRAIVDPERDATVDIHLGGLPVDFAAFENSMMKMPIYFGAAFLIIMLIQYWSFRSAQGMLLPILTAILSVIWALGFMGLIGMHMDGLNTTTPILIMSVAAGHAIQILKRYYEEYGRIKNVGTGLSDKEINQKAIVESLTRVGPVMSIAGLIAVVSFLTLSTSEISVARHFGVFAGSGILAAMILEMTLIPALRSILRPPKLKEIQKEKREGFWDRALAALARALSGGQALKVLSLSLLFIGAIVLGVFKIDVDNSLKRYTRPDSEVRKDDAALNANFGGTNTIYFLVQGSKPEALKDPKVLKGMDALQAFLVRQSEVGKAQSLVDMIKRINQAMHADDPKYFEVPDDQALIAQYLFMYTLSGEPQDFDSFVDNDYQKAAIWVFLKTDSTNYASKLFEKAQEIIKKEFPDNVTVSLGGSLPQTIAGNEALTRGKLMSILQMVLVVFILSSFILRSFVGGIFVTTPLLIVVLANFGVMGWLGIPLDMATMTTAAMAIGIGADYELYLLFRFREELANTGDLSKATHNSLTTSGKAIIYVAISIAAGYSFLLTSDFAFYTRLAVMVIATMLISAFGAIIFLRAMTMIFKPKFIFGYQK